MKLYNTLTRTIDEIKPQNAPEVTVYTCGPTVYDYPHIGNWFAFLREDVLIRTLKLSGLQPKWVMNITDVGHLVSDADDGEDKLEKGARREGKNAWDVAKLYTTYFEEGMQRLNMLRPDYLPRATDHINEQITLIKTLETKDYTYTISDGVYFDTSKFPTYADFARLDLDEQEAGKRVIFNTEKRNLADFALWKFSPTDHKRDMEWESPWGTGFPGWHVECSAMSMKYLGETLDIHAGGIDHLPVHHTNEITQSEAATGKQFANAWMHSNHITVNDEKISKSLGNSITLEDIEARGYALEVLRLHVLESHYRNQSKFSWDSLGATKNRLQNWQAIADLRFQPKDTTPERQASVDAAINKACSDIQKCLEDDLNTPQALAKIDGLFNVIGYGPINKANIDSLVTLLRLIEQGLGIDLLKTSDVTPEQVQSIGERSELREQQKWAESDAVRDNLIDQGIGLRDIPQGVVWFRL